mmetsp:Transcript_7665/g.13854  ORF Transcript_7665/g.13854 Transcript_7665/m.13854 type:complete len:203 (+) Transcript_7665:656-1264(+)
MVLIPRLFWRKNPSPPILYQSPASRRWWYLLVGLHRARARFTAITSRPWDTPISIETQWAPKKSVSRKQSEPWSLESRSLSTTPTHQLRIASHMWILPWRWRSRFVAFAWEQAATSPSTITTIVSRKQTEPFVAFQRLPTICLTRIWRNPPSQRGSIASRWFHLFRTSRMRTRGNFIWKGSKRLNVNYGLTNLTVLSDDALS